MGSRSYSNGLSGLLVLLVVGGYGARVATTRLATPRPQGTGAAAAVSAPPGMVRSRLWQDPLQARDEAGARLTGDAPTPLPGRIKAPGELTGREAPDVLVMPLFLTPSPTPESEDIRIGMRYAVLSALSSAGFTPDQREYLRCFHAGEEAAKAGVLREESALMQAGPVVYEWLVLPDREVRGRVIDPAYDAYDAVLVLWLDDGPFRSEHQICDMDELMGFVAWSLAGGDDEAGAGEDGGEGDHAHAHSHPHAHEGVAGGFKGTIRCAAMTGNSNRLVDLFIEGAHLAPLTLAGRLIESADELSHDVRFFAWSATISNEALIANVASSLGSMPRLAKDGKGVVRPYIDVAAETLDRQPRFRFPARGGELEVVRTIGTDLQLMELLVNELRLRGVNRDDRIVLIHEWDSVYGRSLPETFCTAAATGEDESVVFRNIQKFHYLRGVDGKLPGDPPSSSGGASGGREAPVGRSRLDYVRRLVDRLLRETEHWTESDQSGGGRLAAIGVLGGDPYDKAPIIQALREQFPDAIFFTTDLQAGLVHESAYPYTRNLLIASHFDLQLAAPYQCGAPPFRTSYDTALYYSVLCAIEAAAPTTGVATSVGAAASSARPGLPPGRVYEVARSGAYDLATTSDGVFYPISPRRTIWPDWPVGYVGLLLAIVFGAAFVVFTRASVRAPEAFGRLFGWRNWLLLAAALAPAAFLLFAELIGRYAPNDEPFEWLDGVSIWPSEFIRLCGVLLCIAFAAAMTSSYQTSIQDLCRRYRLRPDRVPVPLLQAARSYAERLRMQLRRSVGEAWASVRARATHWVRHRVIVNWGTAREGGPPRSFDEVWASYLARGRARHRLLRTLLVALLGAGLLTGLALLDRPRMIQHRGWMSLTVQIVMTVLSVGLVNLLAFVVWDAIRLCSRFIWNLRQGVRFSPESRHVIRDQCGLNGREADAWLTMRIAAERTQAVSRVIYYPFIVVFVLLLARYRGFDHWGVSMMLVVGYGLSLLVTVIAAIQMRRAAEDLRAGEIERLQHRLGRLESGVEFVGPEGVTVEALPGAGRAIDEARPGRAPSDASTGSTTTAEKTSTKKASKKASAEADAAAREKAVAAARALRKAQIERTIEAIRGVRDGAFAPLTQHPVLRAVLIPFGGLGAVEIVNFLASSGI